MIQDFLPRSKLNRLLFGIAAFITLITLYAHWRGPDCDSGTTDNYSPDLKADQLKFLDKHFPEAFDDHSVDARLLTLIRAADPVPETKHQVFLDIGAGEARFTFGVLRAWGHQDERDDKMRLEAVGAQPEKVHETEPQLVAAEPTIHVFDVSQRRFDLLRRLSDNLPRRAVELYRMAVCDVDGEKVISQSDGGETLGVGEPVDKIRSITIDSFLKEKKIEKIALAKINVEGFETAVIDGMFASLKARIIEQVILDYGHLWKKEHTGLDFDWTLKALQKQLSAIDMNCYLVSKNRLLKISDDYW
eukprot:CAMPEP_0168596208 /NCGR_PEP_ID=MMETSP0420-20121227/9898_1 /TAXON_ID=498008 /ORGANISM="Pessonella sp." /LENGTH=302 /DNA_ID=CAMNT_0008632757 /DNA_START=40 /DNA_END=945 /DNA_ORIENTATION=-